MSQIEEKIAALLRQQNLNIRDSKYRFMDQKLTPDILAFIADCVNNLPGDKRDDFVIKDIWHLDYFVKNVVMLYSKPSPEDERAKSEYDKFIAQPLKTLSFAGVLSETKQGNRNHYAVSSPDILTYIALNERNAFYFLAEYVTSVLSQSGFYHRIQSYIDAYKRNNFSKAHYDELKKAFIAFMIGNTNINQEVEPRRIFPKILNVVAVLNGVPGSKKGSVSKDPYLYSDLTYNAKNFRDLHKKKNVSRQEAATIESKMADFTEYEIRKAMDAVRNRHRPDSEVKDQLAQGDATNVHHIFSRSNYPDLRSTPENLILLTPQQHYTKAHPGNKTSVTDPDYQLDCLLSKLHSVRESEANSDAFYSKEGFVNVINNGFGLSLSSELSFDEIANRLRQYHQQS